jgi:RNA polymerase sigma-70 factor (ECF subfamily)
VNWKETPLVGASPAVIKSDAELVQRCRLGDSAAWEQVVRTFSRRVYNLAYRFTGRHEPAEDLIQEVFVRVYRSLDQYDPEAGDLAHWLMRLARNLIIDDYRRRIRTPTDLGDDLESHQYHLRSASETPERGIERSERAHQVHQAIARLSPELRECVILRDLEELSYLEIVDLLQIPLGTVKSRINRGRIELARILRRMKVAEGL